MFNENNKPPYVSALIEEYNDIKFDSCGHRGTWSELLVDGEKVKIRVSISNKVTFEKKYKGSFQIYQVNKDSVWKRYESIAEKIMDRLSGYQTGKKAFEDNFKKSDIPY